MTLPRYGRYRDSGVEWLGEVPAHWQVTRLKFIAHVQTGIAKGKDNAGKDTVEVPYLRVANVQDGYLDLEEVATIEIPADDLPRYRLRAGDVLMNEGGDFDKLGRGHVWDGSIDPCIHQNHVFAVRPFGASPQWLNLITGSAYAQFYFMSRSKQSTNLASISSTNVMELPVVMPPAAEQERIAAFLSNETATIDALIDEQQRLIGLLTEKRQAVIAHALTKGLNPAVPLKDSSVEWLGEVPAHWAVSKLGRYVAVRSGFAFPSTGFSRDEADVRLLRGINVGVGSIRWGEVVYWRRMADDELDDFSLSLGDIVVGMDRPFIGDGTRVARVSAVDLPCLLLQRVAAVHPGPNLLGGLLVELLASDFFVHHIGPDTTGVSVPHISPDQICEFRIPVPPIGEQTAILLAIEGAEVQTAGLVAEARLAVTLLRERRTALISAAVTGQIDVRNTVAKVQTIVACAPAC